MPFWLALKAFGSGAMAFFRKVPWQVWAAIGLALAIWLGVRWYNGQIKEAEQRGADARDAYWNEQAKGWLVKIYGITSKLRSQNNVEIRRIDADARSLLVRGPGKAVCPNGVPAASSGHVAPAGTANAPVAQVPDGERVDLIALPFAPTIEFGRSHDQCQADLKSYRDWEVQIRDVWAKMDRP